LIRRCGSIVNAAALCIRGVPVWTSRLAPGGGPGCAVPGLHPAL